MPLPTAMSALPPRAHRSERTSSDWRLASLTRSLLPVLAMLLLAAATAFGAWLLLFAIDYGCRMLGGG